MKLELTWMPADDEDHSAPPIVVAVLAVKVQLCMWHLEVVHAIAPPRPKPCVNGRVKAGISGVGQQQAGIARCVLNHVTRETALA
jgi:hypothetical protein